MSVVSIVITAHNDESVIAEAIESAARQSFRDIEIIVVDDASTDQTRAVVSALAAVDDRIRLVQHEDNRQLLEARRTGMRAAKSPYVFYLDADDTLRIDAIEHCVRATVGRGDELLIVQTSANLIYEGIVPEETREYNESYFRACDGELHGDDITHESFRDFRTSWNMWGKLFSRRILEQAFLEIPTVRIFQNEDTLTYFIASHFADTCIGLSEVVGIDYRCSTGGSTRYSNICQSGLIFPIIDSFLDRNGLRIRYWDDRRNTGIRCSDGVADYLMRHISSSERADAYKMTLDYWPADEIIAAFKRVCADEDWRSVVGVTEDSEGRIGNVFHSGKLKTLVKQLFESDSEAAAISHIAEMAGMCKPYTAQLMLLKILQRYSFTIPIKTVDSVAQYYYRMGDGGVEGVMADFASVFDSMGLRSVIFTDEVCPEDNREINGPAKVRAIGALWTQDDRVGYIASHLARMARELQRCEVKAVVYHAHLSSNIIWDLLLCKRMGIRFYIVIHQPISYPFARADSKSEHFSLLPYQIALCDGVVCSTELSRNYYARFNNNAFVMPDPLSERLKREHAITLASEELVILEEPHAAPKLLWVDCLEEASRPLDALHVIAELRKNIPSAKLVMLGKGGNGRMTAKILELCASLGLREHIVFCNHADDVMSFYHDADALLITSEIGADSFVLLEAATAGLPIVMYGLSSLAAMRSRGLFVVPFGDTHAASRTLTELFSDRNCYSDAKKATLGYVETLIDYKYADAWQSVFSCAKRLENVFEAGGEDALMWEAILDQHLIGCQQNENRVVDVRDSVERELKESLSYRLGHALLALPRKISRWNM